ncbi:MAG: DNA-binding protein [Nitrosopumilales archaeon]|jgi:replication factor A1|nr:DNA-binding protein [Nitrosopumilales archaeon]MBI3253284.1 DNA-binding protein [Nitrosopumilales archaeon]
MVTTEQAKNMRSGINIEGTVERKGEPRTVNMKSGGTIQVCDAFLIDETGGEIKLTLWGDEVEQVKDGSKVKIENGYTTSFKGEVSLTKGKYGKLEIIS